MATKGYGKKGAPPPPLVVEKHDAVGKSKGKGGPRPGGWPTVLVQTAAVEPEEENSTEDPLLSCPLSERFEVGDPNAMEYFHENGYAVFKAAADSEQLYRAEQLLWDFLEANTQLKDNRTGTFLPDLTWKRDKPDSWSDEGLELVGGSNAIANGLCNKRGAGQSDLDWYIRTLPNVRRVFEQVWETSDLITSFDCFGLFRPWHGGKYFKTLGGWFHVDQATPGRQCIQGLFSIYDQNASTGGLTVIPGSHHRHDEHVQPEPFEEYIAVARSDPLWRGQHHVVQMEAGDFVIWDSRTVHCNSPAIETPTTSLDRLLRAVVYVCMTPRNFASAEVLQARIRAYEGNMTTTHWPHKYPTGFGFAREPALVYETAPPERQALI